MHPQYSFLKDELALVEIRKHKWIESEKAGKEIGFASAAIDWVKKHGKRWQEFRLRVQDLQNIFDERRQHRRFTVTIPVELKLNEGSISSYTNDINLIGLTCVVPVYIPPETKAEITITQPAVIEQSRLGIKFLSRVLRISESTRSKAACGYQIFIPFTEQIRDYLRENTQSFATISGQLV